MTQNKQDLNRPASVGDIMYLLAQNNEIIFRVMDEKIRQNNEYLFEQFNNQFQRIVDMLDGVVKVKKDMPLKKFEPMTVEIV